MCKQHHAVAGDSIEVAQRCSQLGGIDSVLRANLVPEARSAQDTRPTVLVWIVRTVQFVGLTSSICSLQTKVQWVNYLDVRFNHSFAAARRSAAASCVVASHTVQNKKPLCFSGDHVP